MPWLVITAVVLSLVACDGATRGQPNATPQAPLPTSAPTQITLPTLAPTQVRAPRSTAPPAPIPLINVDNMMGMYPQQTVFVATSDHVSAVTLLNHFTRYRIATNGVARVSTDSSGQWLYVLDAEAPGSQRLRVFNVPTGTERAVHHPALAGVVVDQRVLGTAFDGRVLVLKSDERHAWVDAYTPLSLHPLGVVMEKPGCGDRLLTSRSRVAIVCHSNGEIAVDDLRGNHAEIDATLPNLVAAAMTDDGTLLVATADQRLASLPNGATTLVSLAWPSEWSGTVVPDGLAVVPYGSSALLAQRTDDGAWLRVFATKNIAQRRSLRLAGVPQGGILALDPFAYYTVDGTIRHIDLTSGLLETMAEVSPGAVLGAVVNG